MDKSVDKLMDFPHEIVMKAQFYDDDFMQPPLDKLPDILVRICRASSNGIWNVAVLLMLVSRPDTKYNFAYNHYNNTINTTICGIPM